MNKEYLRKITELRHELHRHPELSMTEKETSRIIQEFLRQNTGFQVVDCGEWFYAVKEGAGKEGSGKAGKIAFRADMDALPIPESEELSWHSLNAGVSHRCGHDGHCAALCGLAMELDRAWTDKMPSVYLVFQPGEEIGQGAVLCKDLIRQEGISEIFAFHNLGGYPEKCVVYRSGLTQPSSEGLKIRFTGKTSHASEPEAGRNPAEVISKTVLHAEEVVRKKTEQHAEEVARKKTEPQAEETVTAKSSGLLLCTVTGIKVGSGDFGISPGDGQLCLTLRAEYESELKRLEADILSYAGKLCEEADIQMTYSLNDYFPETRNHDVSLGKVIRAAKDLQIPVMQMQELWRASEDFGWYLKECPGAMVYIGTGEEYPALHTEEYDFNDSILETAVDLFLRVATVHTG